MGIATGVAVHLTPDPPCVATMLCAFDGVEAAAATVSGVIAAGVPAALEMMDARITRAVEDFVGAGYPRDAQAVLLAEVDGFEGGVAEQVEAITAIARANGATLVRVAADEAERALLWKGRKSAFGAIARIAPDYYLHDAVVPRTKLVDVLRRVYEIADAHELIVMNVFHAGDGNLHPLLVFDGRDPGVWDRVYAAGTEILDACLAAGECSRANTASGSKSATSWGACSRPTTSTPRRACAMRSIPTASPTRRRCCRAAAAAASSSASRRARGYERVRTRRARRHARRHARRCANPLGGRRAAATGAVEVRAPVGVIAYEPADMTITVGAGTSFDTVDGVLAEHGQECALDPRSRAATIGGILACGLSGVRRLRHGPVRDHVLEVRFETGDGRLVKGGGPTVKNVTGYDLRACSSVRWERSVFSNRQRCVAGRGLRGRAGSPAPSRRARTGRRRACGTASARWCCSKGSTPTWTCRATDSARSTHARAAGWSAPRSHLGRTGARPWVHRRARRPRPLVRGARRRHGARRGRRSGRAGLRTVRRARARGLDAPRGRWTGRRRRLRLPAPERARDATREGSLRSGVETEPPSSAAESQLTS